MDQLYTHTATPTPTHTETNPEECARILLIQVYVDHLEQVLDLIVTHLSVLVQICSSQIASNPSGKS